ncbi:ImmA/IrrE family metallo-endopeptidase [Radiobacillus kanasensis]|uniref:ImmA/IrrE family metallo-endopeptidase n=1 Tax=Radiobacillus kanasensis TaxID=2844358 RepID=UPI001E335CA9|nr:ImmA/IrrE family metallo-endopeptidase [Radiobacillus kanasensis]UFT98134.1 ImmA/IrrE family metallo-endopeptidase [Radiobacillus kanasensis]
MDIQKKVQSLVEKYNTCCPFELAAAMGINVQYEQLGNIYGYYNKVFRIPIIHINESIGEKKQLFTCTHELGHAVYHPDHNTSFLKKHTLFSTDKIEIIANQFALELLSLKEGMQNLTIDEVVQLYGFPKQLVLQKSLGKIF